MPGGAPCCTVCASHGRNRFAGLAGGAEAQLAGKGDDPFRTRPEAVLLTAT